MNKTLECYPGLPCTGCKQKNRLTEVLNLATGDTLSYSLPPERAVVSAYMTQTKKNHNWWNYDWTIAKVSKSGVTVHCGDFAAIVLERISNQVRA